MDQTPVQIGQFILGKNLGIGAFGKVRYHRSVEDCHGDTSWIAADSTGTLRDSMAIFFNMTSCCDFHSAIRRLFVTATMAVISC
jgi:hypothetical protein